MGPALAILADDERAKRWRWPMAATWVAFVATLWLAGPGNETRLVPLGVVPIVLTGLVLGRNAGLVGAVLALAVGAVVHLAHGNPVGSLSQQTAQNLARWTVGLGLGYGSGALADAWRRQARTAQQLQDALAARDLAQRNLVSAQHAWDLLLANAPEAVLLVDENLRVAFANRAPGGRRAEDVLGQPVERLVEDPWEREALLEALRAALGGDGASTVEVRGPGPGGAAATYSCRIAPSRTAQGRPAALMVNTDVTAVRKAEADLRASEARWRSLVQNAPAFILTCDREGRITFVNRTVPGLPMEQVMGRPAWELAPGDQEATKQAILQVVRDNKPALQEGEGPGPDGVRRFYSVHWSPVPGSDGGPASLLAMAFDVTEARAAGREREEAERRMEEHEREAQHLKAMADFKTQFLNNAAHELATPLTPLKLHLAALRMSPLAQGDRAGFDLLERNVSRLGTLVNDLLDAARLQSGHLRLRTAAVDLPELLARTASSFKAQARGAGVTLGVEPSLPVVASCDETRVEQVLFNLVHNAIKFTPRGGQVWLRADVDGQSALLQVRDTGVGLTLPQMEALFQPFTQVHEPAGGKAGGTGLGLYIARGIAQQHGGMLTVASQGPGQGSCFTLRIPLTPAAGGASSLPATASAPRPASGAPGAPPAAP